MFLPTLWKDLSSLPEASSSMIVPQGASYPEAELGVSKLAKELYDQINELNLGCCTIAVASGTGNSQAVNETFLTNSKDVYHMQSSGITVFRPALHLIAQRSSLMATITDDN